MANPAEVRRETPGLPVPLGEVVAGKYRLDRILGSSGMGIVYGGTHVGIDQLVAVKFLLVKNGTEDDALVRFTREAKFMAKINSEHVVRVLDVGALPDATPFIVMEHLQGDDLARLLHKHGPLPIETAVDYVLQACEGLATAHAAGVIHRDLKPSNLFLTKLGDGREIVKLIDFGVAKYRGTDTNPQNDSLTQTHVMIGSPRYMAPEQVRASKDVDARSDVWSLAVILQELLTGRPVFKGPTVSDTFVIILTEDPMRADAIRPDIPAGLADLITRALIKDVTYRTPTVASFASELISFASPTQRFRFETVFNGTAIPPPPRSFSGLSGAHRGMVASSGSFPQYSGVSEVNADVETRTAGGTPIAPKPASRSPKVAIALGVLGVLALIGIVAGVLALQHRAPGVVPVASATVTASSVPATGAPLVTNTTAMVEPASPTTTPSARSSAKPGPVASAPPTASSVNPAQRFVGRPAITGAPPKGPGSASAAAAPPPPPPPPPGSLFDDPK